MNEHCSPADVLFISMPWQWVASPSIQTGILTALLNQAGLNVRALSLNLDFLERCYMASDGVCEEIRLDDFHKMEDDLDWTGLDLWVFAVPPLISPSQSMDEEFFAHLKEKKVEEKSLLSH